MAHLNSVFTWCQNDNQDSRWGCILAELNLCSTRDKGKWIPQIIHPCPPPPFSQHALAYKIRQENERREHTHTQNTTVGKRACEAHSSHHLLFECIHITLCWRSLFALLCCAHWKPLKGHTLTCGSCLWYWRAGSTKDSNRHFSFHPAP